LYGNCPASSRDPAIDPSIEIVYSVRLEENPVMDVALTSSTDPASGSSMLYQSCYYA